MAQTLYRTTELVSKFDALCTEEDGFKFATTRQHDATREAVLHIAAQPELFAAMKALSLEDRTKHISNMREFDNYNKDTAERLAYKIALTMCDVEVPPMPTKSYAQRTIPALTWNNLNRRADAILLEYGVTNIITLFGQLLQVQITHKNDDRIHYLIISPRDLVIDCDCPFFRINKVCAHSLGARKLCIDAKVWTNSDFASLTRKESFLVDKCVQLTVEAAVPLETELTATRATLTTLEKRLSLLDTANRALAAMAGKAQVA